MEMQIYPPGWLFALFGEGTATQWTAALNTDSFQSNDNTGKNINAACAAIANNEYVNFAFIQTDGVSFPAGSPSPLGPPVSTNANTLLMNRIRHAAHRVRHNPAVPTAPVEPRG
jgi:hypothetical protein